MGWRRNLHCPVLRQLHGWMRPQFPVPRIGGIVHGLAHFYRGDGEEWIMHAGLGWLYPSPSYGGGGWFWNEDLKWVWTNSEHYPFLFSNTGGAWLYFYGKHRNEILFYHYGENKWIVNRL